MRRERTEVQIGTVLAVTEDDPKPEVWMSTLALVLIVALVLTLVFGLWPSRGSMIPFYVVVTLTLVLMLLGQT
jgi:hypothetical protein